MTSLQSFILRTIHRRGPQSEAALWNHSRCETLPAVCRAIATLAEAEFIEHTPRHQNPHRFPTMIDPAYWQLTHKGHQHIAALGAAAACNAQQQEVCLGS
jgi:hypothetical protein